MKIIHYEKTTAQKIYTLIALLFFIITLLYFRLIRFSNPVPYGHDTVQNTSTKKSDSPLPLGNNDRVYTFASRANPLSATAPNDHYLQLPISHSTMQMMGAVALNISFSFTVHDPEKKGVSGLLLDNKFPFNDPDSRRLQFFYWEKTAELLFQFQHGDTSQYASLTHISNSHIITLLCVISSDGKSVSILLPAGTAKTITLDTSLYDTTNIFQTNIILSPNSHMDLQKLVYFSPFQ